MRVNFNVDKDNIHDGGIYALVIDGIFFFGRTNDFWKQYTKIHHKLLVGEEISGRLTHYLENKTVHVVDFVAAEVGDYSCENLRRWIKQTKSRSTGFNSEKPFKELKTTIEDFILELGKNRLRKAVTSPAKK